jgi:Mitochondrial ribosomal protein (VAR1)
MNIIKNKTKNNLLSTSILLQKRLNLNLKGLKKYNNIFILNTFKNEKILLIENLKIYQVSNLNTNDLTVDNKILSPLSNKELINSNLLKNNKNIINNKQITDIKSINILNCLLEGINFNYSQQVIYNFNSYNDILIKKIYYLLYNSFISMNTLISKPILNISSEKIRIDFFIYFYKHIKKSNKINSFININKNKINILSLILSHLFKKPVELSLNRIYYPYFDSNIFVNLLANIINILRIKRIVKKFFRKAVIIKNPFHSKRKTLINKIPSVISGIKIKIGGRLLTHRIVPRKTSLNIRKGALSRIRINYLDTARYTNKNNRGAFSITFTSAQIFKSL